MVCEHCGNTLDMHDPICRYCHPPETEVKVLTPEERRQFQGMTLEQDHHSDKHDDSFFSDGKKQGYRFIHVNSAKVGMVTKLLLGVVFALFLFFAFSSLAVFVVVGGLFFLFSRLFRLK